MALKLYVTSTARPPRVLLRGATNLLPSFSISRIVSGRRSNRSRREKRTCRRADCRALYRAAETGRPVMIRSVPIRKRPTLKQEKYRPL